MKISSNNHQMQSTPNFTAIRIVKTTPEQFVKFTNEFNNFCNKNTVFRAQSIEQDNFFNKLFEKMKNNKYSDEWFVSNLLNNDLLKSDSLQNLPMIVITGFDRIKLALYGYSHMFSNIKLGAKAGAKAAEEKFPEHLQVLKALKEVADNDIPRFQKFLEKNKAKHLTFEEFLAEVKSGKIK